MEALIQQDQTLFAQPNGNKPLIARAPASRRCAVLPRNADAFSTALTQPLTSQSVRDRLRAYNIELFRRKTSMECTVRWTGLSGMSFVAETGSGHLVTMDGAPDGGGRNLAPRPMEVVLAGTGGCTAYDVVVILRKSGQDIRGCEVTLKSERAEKDPKVFTKVHFHFIVQGRNLKANLVERAIKLSHEKYCSASIMMEKTAELTHSYEIIDDLADLPAQTTSA
jgi:putative redox protein